MRSRPKTLWAYLVANGLPVPACVTTIPRSKRPEHTRTNASRSLWAVSIPAWILKTNPEKAASSALGSPELSARDPGDGDKFTSTSRSW